MQLDAYSIGNYSPGAPLLRQLAWFFLGSHLVRSRLFVSSALKVAVLRFFGAKIGASVRIKPGVTVKFPWRLSVGDYSWIGESVWIDNLAPVEIGSNCCISQGVYFCTGNHDWSKTSFDLKVDSIVVNDKSWIAAKSCLGPGVCVEEGAVLTLGGVASEDLKAWTIYQGNPATAIGKREIGSKP